MRTVCKVAVAKPRAMAASAERDRKTERATACEDRNGEAGECGGHGRPPGRLMVGGEIARRCRSRRRPAARAAAGRARLRPAPIATTACRSCSAGTLRPSGGHEAGAPARGVDAPPAQAFARVRLSSPYATDAPRRRDCGAAMLGCIWVVARGTVVNVHRRRVPGAAQREAKRNGALPTRDPGSLEGRKLGPGSAAHHLVLRRVRGTRLYPAALSLAKVSRRPMVRLNTSLPGALSRSGQK